MENTIPDKNLFMMCPRLESEALSDLSEEYYIRNCRKDELDIWMDFPFNTPEEAERNRDYMVKFFKDVYGSREDVFYEKCLFVCDSEDSPIATCMDWKAYNKITTIHWLKVLKEYEGLGIGRALLSIIMQNLSKEEYPVFLHTQPSSYRAIKLYTDLGFYLLNDPVIGTRKNHLEESLPILKKYMHPEAYQALKITQAPSYFLEVVSSSSTVEF